MKIDEIREIAKRQGVKAGRLKKSELVRSIQQAEGSQQCFDTNNSKKCGQPGCLWREDCV